jgi:undecaprenyl-diphosphatase
MLITSIFPELAWTQVLVLALVQGLTEFLPISSSAHLLLFSHWMHWPDQGLFFDVMLHLGSLGALCIYFRQPILGYLRILPHVMGSRTPPAHELRLLIIATLPVVIVGALMADKISLWVRPHAPQIIAATTISFAVLLAYAHLRRQALRTITTLKYWQAAAIGCMQILALLPGTSRAGITLTAGLLCGLSKQEGSRFAFLMAMPVIAGAAIFELKPLVALALQQSLPHTTYLQLLAALALSWLASLLAIHLFLCLINKIGLLPFVGYRLVLGLILCWHI